MQFSETNLTGAYIIDIEPFVDERGAFARGFCQREFADHGLRSEIAQVNISVNSRAGTLRGMHYQRPPYSEAKIVRCTRGALYDVIVDLRPQSPTFLEWIGVELTEQNCRTLYVPEHFGHGFITLQDDTEAYYLVSEFYTPDSEGGLRWNDPTIAIQWPREPIVISDKDANWSDFDPAQF